MKKDTKFTPDLELLIHKYSDYYENFIIYDTREIDYPIYKTKVEYIISKEQGLHPIMLGFLKIIDHLKKIKDKDKYQILENLTQMDSEILANVLAELSTKGYLKADTFGLSHKGQDVLKKEYEKTKEQMVSYVAIDGVLGEVIGVCDSHKDMIFDNKSNKEAFEFKPNFNTRPRMESLNDNFVDNKTLRQHLIEALNQIDRQEKFDIDDILSLTPNKFYKKYFCIFYKNANEEERILVIDNQYNEDIKATKLFERLEKEQKISENVNQNANEYKQNLEKFQTTTPDAIEQALNVNLENDATIQTQEHKKYLKYVLKNAKKEIFLQSPWIRSEILDIYKNDIDDAIKRGVKITIKYGIKPRSRHDKVGIDNKSKEYFNGLDKKLFKLIQGNDHSKILICDDEFMIIGSFNWLSFGGEEDKDGDIRGETSSINKNKKEIAKQKEKF